MFKLMDKKIIAILRKLFCLNGPMDTVRKRHRAFTDNYSKATNSLFTTKVFAKIEASIPVRTWYNMYFCFMAFIVLEMLCGIKFRLIRLFYYKSTKEGKDQESIQSSTTPDPRYPWESNKLTIRHNKREPRGQPFPSR